MLVNDPNILPNSIPHPIPPFFLCGCLFHFSIMYARRRKITTRELIHALKDLYFSFLAPLAKGQRAIVMTCPLYPSVRPCVRP